jgi:TrmH family RNA methyltransferase
VITSAQNSKIQLVRALIRRSKERRQESAFVIEGVRLVEEALSAGWRFRNVLYTSGLSERGRAVLKVLTRSGVEVEETADHLLASSSDTETPQGLLAVIEHQSLVVPKKLDLVLVLDELRDPGNLGSLLRSAAAADAQAVFLTPGCADAFSPKVLRAGMGAHFRLPIEVLDWESIHARLADLELVLAEMKSPLSFWQADLRRGLALVIGGEAEGASQAAELYCTQRVHIPMAAGSESLNAAAAGAILLFEIKRQRQA